MRRPRAAAISEDRRRRFVRGARCVAPSLWPPLPPASARLGPRRPASTRFAAYNAASRRHEAALVRRRA
nr:hypothetical protein E2R29_15425 [Burkholderia pseudomallei]